MSTEKHPPSGTRTARSVGDESADRPLRPFGAALPVDSVQLVKPDLLEHRVARLSTLTLKAPGPISAAEPEVLIARQAAARVEAAEGWHELAAARLTGQFDGDVEQSIALETIAVLRENDMLKHALDAESLK